LGASALPTETEDGVRVRCLGTFRLHPDCISPILVRLIRVLGFGRQRLTNFNEKGKRTRATTGEVALRVMETVALTFLLVNGCPNGSIYRIDQMSYYNILNALNYLPH
jgi:hypothetical protein